MKVNTLQEGEIIEIIIYSCIAFLLMGFVLIVFFYFSRKKIIQKEFEKKDLEIQYQKELLNAVIFTQEEERKRIAQDLHDDISSKLNVISLNSHLLITPNLSKNEIAEITESIISLTGKTLDSARKIAHGLLPPVLDKFGLHAGIEELCLEYNSSKAVVIDYKNDVQFDAIQNDRNLHVFRILQELINNSMRHGKASLISIFFEEKKGVKSCHYRDNGIGFDIKSDKNKKGLGMKNIESRVSYLKGTISVDSDLDKGIKVIFNF